MSKIRYSRILIRGVHSNSYKAHTTKPENIIKAIKSICSYDDYNKDVKFVTYIDKIKLKTRISITHSFLVTNLTIFFVQKSLINRRIGDGKYLSLDRDDLEWIFKLNHL